MRPRPELSARASASAITIVTGIPTSTKQAVTPMERRNVASVKSAAYWSSPTKSTANGERMSVARKSVNDMANELTSGTSMKTAKTATNGRQKPQATIA